MPEYELDYLGGNCPVQAEGKVGDVPFYFRARGAHWCLGIGEDPVGEPVWIHEEAFGSSFEAGWMEEDEARRFREFALARHAAGLPGNRIPN